MEEKNIIITVENYRGKKFTFIIPPDASIELMRETTIEAIFTDDALLNGFNIDVRGSDIKMIQEDI